MMFPPNSLQRVYFHGLWQRSRGRQPSMQLSNMLNPRNAFLKAQELEGPYLRPILEFLGLRTFRAIYQMDSEFIDAVIDHTF